MTTANEIAIVAVSRRGAALGARLRDALGGNATLYAQRRFAGDIDGAIAFDLPLRPLIARLFAECDGLVLMLPIGAAVRLIAPHIADKHTDPAVVCVDDAGRFAVSLLSGHIGGADALTRRIADAIGATAVITSASHSLDTLAVDLLGSEFGWRIEASSAAVTRASAAVINGDPVGVYQDAGERDWRDMSKPLPSNIHICETLSDLGQFSAVLLITDRVDIADMIGADASAAIVTYRPRSLAVGVGCRRGVDVDELDALLRDTFAAHRLSPASIGCIATADIKRDEPAIRLLGERLGAPVRCYDSDALNSAPGPSGPSAARRLLGVYGVSEQAALLASGGGAIVAPRTKSARATIAVARMAQ